MSIVSTPDYAQEPIPQLFTPPISSLDKQETFLAKRPRPASECDGSLPEKRQRICRAAWLSSKAFGQRKRKVIEIDSDEESSSHSLSSHIGSPLSPFIAKPKQGRRIKWLDEEDFESVKYFKLTDLPSAQGLCYDEIVEVQEAVRGVPPSQKLEEVIKLDQAILRRREEKTRVSLDQPQAQLNKMAPVCSYSWARLTQCLSNQNQASASASKEAVREREVQAQREQKSYRFEPLQLRPPMNPLQEFSCFRPRDGDCSVRDLEAITASTKKRRLLDNFLRILNKEHTSVIESTEFSQDQKQTLSAIISSIRARHVEVSDDRLAAMSFQALKHSNDSELARLEISKLRSAHQPAELIQYANTRTVPCKNFHGPHGCFRGDACRFIHDSRFERRPLPREVFNQHRNESLRRNMLDAIRHVNPEKAEELERLNVNSLQLNEFIVAHNSRVSGGNQGLLPQKQNSSFGLDQGQGKPHLSRNQPIQELQVSVGKPSVSGLDNCVPYLHPERQMQSCNQNQRLVEQPSCLVSPPAFQNKSQLGFDEPRANQEIQRSINQLKQQMSTPGLQPQHLVIISSHIQHLILVLQYRQAQRQGDLKSVEILKPYLAQSQLKQNALARQLSAQLSSSDDDGMLSFSSAGSSSL